MARTYASLLGLLAPSVLLTRAVIHGWGADETLTAVMLAAAIFAGVGLVAGAIAELLVQDSVQGQFRAALAEFAEKQETKSGRNGRNA